MPTTYYRVHGGKVTFAEYWRLAANPLEFAFAAVFKLFGGLPLNSSIPRIEAVPYIEWDALPKDARKKLQGPIDLLEDAGYEPGTSTPSATAPRCWSTPGWGWRRPCCGPTAGRSGWWCTPRSRT